MIKFWAGATACLVGLCAGYGLASRNSSGTYSTPNTFVAGTTISSTSMNANFSDLATEMTASLERSGKGGMLAALRGVDGTVSAPAFSWTSETGSGHYRIGSGDLGLSILGTKTGEWTANGLRVVDGALATPSLSFFNETGSGLFRNGASDLRFAVAGTAKTFWNATGFGIGAAPSYPLDVQSVTGATVARFFPASTFPSSIIANTTFAGLLGNLTHDGSNFKYTTSTGASAITYDNTGTTTIYTAPSGTAGNSATVTARLAVGTTGVTIGASGTATAQMNFGSCTLNAGSPATCTATVASGAKCVISRVGGSASSSAFVVAVSGTTMTVTESNGSNYVVNYICFG